MFRTILTSIITCMHLYVFWRAAAVPFISAHVPRKILAGVGFMLWGLFFSGLIIGHGRAGMLSAALEFLGMNWMAALFLIFISLLLTDIVTVFGFLFPRLSPSFRGAALATGMALSVIALIQGLRPPVVERYEVRLAGLPDALDGMVIAGLSDMHLGALIGKRWLADRVAQVNALEPDMVVLLGDIFEGHGPPEAGVLSVFRQLTARLGVWAVYGNHEFHSSSALDFYEKAGFNTLRNQWMEIAPGYPGFIIAGVDDLTTARRRNRGSGLVSRALAGHLAGACILLSHTPLDAEEAAESGADLMLSGHTHGGQIWPFGYLVKKRYPLLKGRCDINGMTVIVCRGTGTWGPRMRLWPRGEILHITLFKK